MGEMGVTRVVFPQTPWVFWKSGCLFLDFPILGSPPGSRFFSQNWEAIPGSLKRKISRKTAAEWPQCTPHFFPYPFSARLMQKYFALAGPGHCPITWGIILEALAGPRGEKIFFGNPGGAWRGCMRQQHFDGRIGAKEKPKRVGKEEPETGGMSGKIYAKNRPHKPVKKQGFLSHTRRIPANPGGKPTWGDFGAVALPRKRVGPFFQLSGFIFGEELNTGRKPNLGLDRLSRNHPP